MTIVIIVSVKWIINISNFLLAVVLLVATTGFTVHKHYCMGQLKDIAVNHAANPCMADGEPIQMPCCEDTSELLLLDEVTPTSFDFYIQPHYFEIASIYYLVFDLSTVETKVESIHFNQVQPLPPHYDLQSKYQVFIV